MRKGPKEELHTAYVGHSPKQPRSQHTSLCMFVQGLSVAMSICRLLPTVTIGLTTLRVVLFDQGGPSQR